MESFQVFWEGRSASDRLYHITSLYNIKNICKENKMNLSYSGASEQEQFKFSKRSKSHKYVNAHGETRRSVLNTHQPNFKKNFYLSTARSLYSSVFNMGISVSSPSERCIIEFDGSKLADKYEIMPVNYWRNSLGINANDEMEDRVLSNEPIMPNIKKYIVGIHAYLDLKKTEEEQKEDLNDLKYVASLGFPVYLYKSFKDYKFLKRERAEVVHGNFMNKVSNKINDIMSSSSTMDIFEKTVANYLEAAYSFIVDPTGKNLNRLKEKQNIIKERSKDMYDRIRVDYSYGHIEGERDVREIMTDIIGTIMRFHRTRNKYIRQAVHKFAVLQRKANKSIQDLGVDAYNRFLTTI